METTQVAVIIARPSRLRDGLETLIAGMPQVDAVRAADDYASSPRLVADTRPVLVFLDAAVYDRDCAVAVATLKAASPNTKCVVLTDSIDMLRHARKSNADCVLLKGGAGAVLFGVVGRLLSQSFAGANHDAVGDLTI